MDFYIIRALNANDLSWLMHIASKVGYGFSSLPNNRAYIEKRVATVVKSFAQEIPPEQRIFLFVLENATTKQQMGLCGLDLSLDHEQLFYNFRVDTLLQTYPELNISVEHKLLRVAFDFQDASELISFWIDPAFRHLGLAKSLSFARFLFIAQHIAWFGPQIIAEIRGSVNEEGISPFWEAAGRPFFKMDYNVADQLTYVDNKRFIAALIAREPIYIDLLPTEAQQVIGVEHKESIVARKMLEEQGFRYNNHVDIFDAGPVIACNTKEIKTVVESKLATIDKIMSEISQSVNALVYNCEIQAKFMSGLINVNNADKIIITDDMAKCLELSVGSKIRYIVL